MAEVTSSTLVGSTSKTFYLQVKRRVTRKAYGACGIDTPDVLQEMKEKEPELFASEQIDDRGNIRFP